MKSKLKSNMIEFKILISPMAGNQRTGYHCITAAILLIFMFFAACQSHTEHNHADDIYTCPMHPEVIKNEPGSCPICHMDLVKKEVSTDSVKVSAHVEDLLNATNATVISSIKTVKATPAIKQFTRQANGIITYDTRQSYSIPARFGGRIEKLLIRFNFQSVKKGDKIIEIYSPELVTAQKELLFLTRSDRDNKNLIEAAKQKLMLLGVSATQVNQIVQSGEVNYTFPVYSPYSGYVVEPEPDKAMATSKAAIGGGMNPAPVAAATPPSAGTEVTLREGMYVAKGQTLFQVVNTENLWAEFDIYTDNAVGISQGDPVEINLRNGETLNATVDFIQPFYQKGGNFKKVRVYLKNADKQFQIGQLVTAEFPLEAEESLWLPRTAVYDLGLRKIVFTKVEDGVFKPLVVETGKTANSQVELLTDLGTETEFAYNAQFLIDGESFIKPEMSVSTNEQ